MDVDKVQEISERTVSYLKRRRYIVGDVYLNRATEVSPRECELWDAVDSSTSNQNCITSLNSVAYDLMQAEYQFSTFKTWITETLNDDPQTDLMPILMPVLCHLYLDILRLHPKQDCINLFMIYSKPLITDEWYQCVQQLLNVPSGLDFSQLPLIEAFRESKFRLKLTHDTLVLLRKFLYKKDLNIIIAILQIWFEFVEADEVESDDDERLDSSRNDELAKEEDEYSYPKPQISECYAKQMEELMKEINHKRLQSTPPPPLLLYTAYRTEGIVCGRISEEHYLAATGDKRSEIQIWRLGESRTNPKLHESYFQSVPLGDIDSDTDSECGDGFDLQHQSTDVQFDVEPIPTTSGHQVPSSSRCNENNQVKSDTHPGEASLPNGQENSNSSESARLGSEFPQQMWPLRGHSDAVYDLAFLPNCKHMVSVSFDSTMRLWNLADFSSPVVYRGHSSPVWGVAVSTIANYVATASSDKTAKLWCLDRTYPVRVMAGHLQAVTCVAFHPNGSYMATGSPDRTVRLWSVTDGAMVRVMGGIPSMGSVETIAFSPNGQYVASAGDDKCVWLWDLASANCILKLTGHTCRIVSVDWSIDGSTVSAASLDGTILLWALDNKDACTGNVVPKRYDTDCTYLLSMEYSRNNSLLAFGLKDRFT